MNWMVARPNGNSTTRPSASSYTVLPTGLMPALSRPFAGAKLSVAPGIHQKRRREVPSRVQGRGETHSDIGQAHVVSLHPLGRRFELRVPGLSARYSGENVLHQLPVNVGQAEVATLEAVGQFLVV